MNKLNHNLVIEEEAGISQLQSRQILERNVYGLLGMPVDVVTLDQIVDILEVARSRNASFVLSTPNLNFLIQSQRDPHFRETLLASDLCPVDGTPIVWLSKVLGIPVNKRVPGSDIFDALKKRNVISPIKVFFFGGAPGVADTVARRINAECPGMKCVGAVSPGYGTIEEMSSSAILEQINVSDADFVAVFLSAKKGQAWVMNNARALRAPIRAQLGATINFQAGTVRRAPVVLHALGLEWLWRIKEEPFLWRRYFKDAIGLIQMSATVVLPILIRRRLSAKSASISFQVRSALSNSEATIHITGAATLPNIPPIQEAIIQALSSRSDLVFDMSKVTDVDARFFGLLIVVRKILNESGRKLYLSKAGVAIERLFRLNRFAYLLPCRD